MEFWHVNKNMSSFWHSSFRKMYAINIFCIISLLFIIKVSRAKIQLKSGNPHPLIHSGFISTRKNNDRSYEFNADKRIHLKKNLFDKYNQRGEQAPVPFRQAQTPIKILKMGTSAPASVPFSYSNSNFNDNNPEKTLVKLNHQIIARGKQKDFKGMMEVLERIETYLTPNVYTMNAVLNGLINCGTRDKRAMGTFWKRFLEQGVVPNTISYNILLKFYSRMPRKRLALEESLRIVEEMKEKRVPLETVTYNCLIKISGLAGDMYLAEKFLRGLRNHGGLCCNEITLSTCLLVMSKSGKYTLQDLFDFFDGMTQNDNVKPNINVLNLLIDQCIEAEEYSLANEIFLDKIEEEGLRPALHTYNIMLKGRRKLNDVPGAEALFENMNEAGLAADQVTYHTMIDIYSRAGQLDKALEMVELVQNSKKLRVIPDTLNPVVLAYQNGAQPAPDLKEYMGTNRTTLEQAFGVEIRQSLELFDKYSVLPDSITTSSLMQPLVVSKQPFRALALYQYLTKERNVRPNLYVYNLVISALAACIYEVQDRTIPQPEQLHLYLDFYKCPEDQGTTIESKMKILLEATEMVLKEIVKKELKPDVVTYNSMMDAAAEAADVQRANQLFVRMSKNFVRPNIFTINTMLRCCSRAGNFPAALDIFWIIEKLKLAPNAHTYSCLANVFINCNETEKAFDLILNMEKHEEIKPHVSIFNCLMKKCSSNGDLEGTQRAFHMYWKLHDQTATGVEGVSAWETFFEALGLLRSSTHANEVFRTIKDQISPELVPKLYLSLMKVHCTSPNPSLVLNTLEEMYSLELDVPEEIYDCILGSFPHQNQRTNVPGAIVKLMKKYDIKISSSVKEKISNKIMQSIGQSLKTISSDRVEQSLKAFKDKFPSD